MGLIKKPNELTVKNALSALIYGQPGMGKTTLALSSPQPLLLDFDGGVHRVNAAHRVDTVQISKWEEVDEVLTSGEIAEYKTIVIDTAGSGWHTVPARIWSTKEYVHQLRKPSHTNG